MGGLNGVRRVYRFWGRHPLLYALQDYATFLGRPASVRRRAVEALALPRGGRVLDVGCGTGRNFPFLEESVGASGRVVGLDLSDSMLAAARALAARNGWTNVSLVQGDAARLDVGEGGFDGVLSTLAFSVIPDWLTALRRCREVLKPGGALVLCDGRLFGDPLTALNPLLRRIYGRLAAWDPDRNLSEGMSVVFGNVSERRFNLGTFVVAKSVR